MGGEEADGASSQFPGAASQLNLLGGKNSNSRVNLKRNVGGKGHDATEMSGMSNNPAGPVSGGAYQSAADVRRLAEEGQLDLNGKLTVTQGTKIFNRGINLLRSEEERLL